jgi:hypothetical protein
MADGAPAADPAASLPTRKSIKWRPWLRAVHRDVGYFVVGLTFIYALSGLAVNHIADWDPNFNQIDRTHELGRALSGSDDQIKSQVLSSLAIDEPPSEIYRAGNSLEIVLESRTLHVDTSSGHVVEEGQQPRFFLRLANWLHLNRGKKAWTIVADGYAVFLLLLATSGLFMIPGRKGLLGRGALIVTAGALVPALYVVLSGGP